jgi:hypothetical protein
MPKEIRNPKSETPCTCAGAWADAWNFRRVESEAAVGALILREDAACENRPREHDLMERTARFGEAIVKLAPCGENKPMKLNRNKYRAISEPAFRISGFGFHSDFGFRISDFPPCFSPA